MQQICKRESSQHDFWKRSKRNTATVTETRHPVTCTDLWPDSDGKDYWMWSYVIPTSCTSKSATELLITLPSIRSSLSCQ